MATARTRESGATTVDDRTVSNGAPAGMTRERMADVRERQRDRFGGFSWGADFFGFLCAAGLTGILAGIVSGAGAATGLTKESAETIGIGGAIALLVVLAIAYFRG